MTFINRENAGGTDYALQGTVPMGTCATPAGTEVKAATFADSFELTAGNLISVTFTYGNTYGDGSTTYPKLTVNGTTYPVKYPTGAYARDGAWANGQAVTFMCDGTNLLMTTLPVVNTVALNNVHSVSSHAVAEAFGTWETIYSATGIVIKGKIINGDVFISVHCNGFMGNQTTYVRFFYMDDLVPQKYRSTENRYFCVLNADLASDAGRLPVNIGIESNRLVGYIIDPTNFSGTVALGGGIFGDALMKVSS